MSQFGPELRRPAADYLRDGIYELRAKQGHVQYRMLYVFQGRDVVVLAHALTKEDEVPKPDIDRAIKRMNLFCLNQIRKPTPMKAKIENKRTMDALAILDRMAGDNPELRQLTDEARVNAVVAQLIFAARAKAGLSQSQLAQRIGTRQSVISRLEDADYEGHSLTMLQRIAAALGQSLEIRFLPRSKVTRGRKRHAPALAQA
ncbi:MAG TPA: type II toxin-antitoxin system RelE/ParE family toxin [Verrucomicrobiae bacterium]